MKSRGATSFPGSFLYVENPGNEVGTGRPASKQIICVTGSRDVICCVHYCAHNLVPRVVVPLTSGRETNGSGLERSDLKGKHQPRPQGLLLDDFQNGVPTSRHFENRRGEGPGDEVGKWARMCEE